MEREELQVTARLARLGLSEDEAAAALPAFERMLGYFAAMKAADEDPDAFGGSVLDLQPSATAFFAADGMRPDIDNFNNNTNANPLPNLANELLNRAPESESRFIVIPNVL
ncbi:MAG: aspartyl/glutamyl-tRNA amidotransferase subunit C [Spirochaetes bacterium]|nr:aspartyl/glutamyl-tRNA amidotransferase subunit C [Spirochaetota bacterium]MBU1079871.1 aspartyl/glutamyl-tRNA amidotransferase subunit C [Spirochaetota bacterium]